MDEIRTIVIADDGISDLFIRVNYIPTPGEWNVVNLEYYKTFQSAHFPEKCESGDLVSDDVDFNSFPHATKMAIWAKLDSAVQLKREQLHRVKMAKAALTPNALEETL